MATFKNTYQPPQVSYPPSVHLDTLQAEYDYNFMFEPKVLASDRVELRPFLPARDAQALLDGVQPNPEIFDYLPYAPWATLNDICVFAEEARRNPLQLRYAIYSAPLDRLNAPKDEYVLAGTLSLIESSVDHMQTEIGWIVILGPFQRTHVLTHACGLTMHRILDSVEDGGLGLRRCQWRANSLNKRSLASALRLGYVNEGTIRALIVTPEGKLSIHDGRPGKFQEKGQRDTWVGGVTWYEWEEGKRAHIDALMARRQ